VRKHKALSKELNEHEHSAPGERARMTSKDRHEHEIDLGIGF